MNKKVQIVLAVVLVLAIAGGSFYGGMVYGKAQASHAATSQFSARQGRFGGAGANGQFPPDFSAQGGQAMPGNGRFGEIVEINGDMLVLTDANGNQVQVKVTDTTLIEKNASVTITDLAAGETVIVSGSENADGTLTARSIQVAPAGRMGFPGAGGNPGAPGNTP